ncbi:MAG TPA: DUF5666 domain-containing protein [Candidatus Dormibacteraeota bacterium]|jgi:hypothetical protein|nr:DUF5666 domain-containing protein [Candidatus Dormibacteraeota bacterium]
MRTPLLIALGAAVAIVLAGGGFVAGRTVATNEAAASASANPGRGARGQGQFGGGGANGAAGANGARALNGQILSVGDGTITVQLSGQDPAAQGSRIVLVSPSTRVVKTTETDVKLADLKAGDRVTIVGQENSDGTVSASAVVDGQNALQNLFPGGRPSPTPTPTR